MRLHRIWLPSGWEDVPGYPVAFDGFEEFEFFVHHDWHNDREWNVSEVSSGCLITKWWPTKKEAIEAAKRVLAGSSKKDVRRRIKRAKAYYGIEEVEG